MEFTLEQFSHCLHIVQNNILPNDLLDSQCCSNGCGVCLKSVHVSQDTSPLSKHIEYILIQQDTR